MSCELWAEAYCATRSFRRIIKRTRPYRTVHSISEAEARYVLDAVAEFGPRCAVDYGCHFGHLSFALAMLPNPPTIYAVDNFRGTKDDDWMATTLAEMDCAEGFLPRFLENLDAVGPHLKGSITPIESDKFLSSADQRLRVEHEGVVFKLRKPG